MDPKYADSSYSGKPNVASARTPDSLVWKTTKAIDLISSVRFSWNHNQNIIFLEFLKVVGPDYKNVDIEPLLFQLDLHGYNDIRNKYGQSIYSLIKKKVSCKLKRTANKMEANGWYKTHTKLNEITHKHNVFGERRDSINPSATPDYSDDNSISSHPTFTSTTGFTKPGHPFLKMPQQELHKGNVENETYEAWYPSSRTQQASPASHPSPQRNRSTRTIEEAKHKRARKCLQDLVLELSHTEKALEEAASAFHDIPQIRTSDKWTNVLRQMILTHYDVQLDASKFYEFAIKNI
ncbi:hypothetical protein F4814DRAFT_453282 [Daldinia grandis]|nr:hypothetical protein F4814DRAFT_453282 [Daldinia grandis]